MTQIADAGDAASKRSCKSVACSGREESAITQIPDGVGHLGETRHRHPAPAQLQANGLQRSGGICDQRRFRTRQTPRGILKPPPGTGYLASEVAHAGSK